MKKEDSHLVWKEISREKKCDCGIFDYYSIRRVNEKGVEAQFVYLDAPDWVTVIAPIEKDGKCFFIMVRQFRHGSGSVTIEFPAGMVELREEPSFAGARELEEETGYRANKMVGLGAVNPNPAFMGNVSYTFLALGLEQKGIQNLDFLESVDIILVSEEEIEQNLGKGLFDNGIMVSAWAFYQAYKKNKK